MKKAFVLSLSLFLLSAIIVCAQNKNVPELWKFSFDERTWEMAHAQDSGGEKLVVYVPKGQTMKDWTESVQMQELHMLSSASVEEFLELLKSAVLKNCPNGQYEIVKNFKGNEAIAEWHSGTCQGLPAEEALVASELFAFAGEPTDKPVLSFSLTATNQSFSHQLTSGLTLRVERDALGWEVGVFKGRSSDSLLYPQRNWHGAYPCQISAWSHRTQTFPDERIIPVRGYKSSVRILLIDAVVSGESGSERFTGGRVEIYWKDNV